MVKIGKKAPYFEGEIEDGSVVSLDDFKGKKLALFFYPKDNTPTCTKQACNIRDNYTSLKKEGISILGVSPDSMRKHTNFINKFDLPFPLLADTEKKTLNAYGVWGRKKTFGIEHDGVFRKTFLINEDGKVVDIIEKVVSKDHATQIIEGFSSDN